MKINKNFLKYIAILTLLKVIYDYILKTAKLPFQMLIARTTNIHQKI